MSNSKIVYELSQEQLEAVVDRAIAKAREVFGPRGGEDAKIEEYATRQEVCNFLKISPPTFHKLVNRGIIAPVKIGRRTLVDLAVVRQKVAAGEIAKYARL